MLIQQIINLDWGDLSSQELHLFLRMVTLPTKRKSQRKSSKEL